jgi:NAD(P)-dependent dehydrogenase (short-subunit alcohol dehydrogenase family)
MYKDAGQPTDSMFKLKLKALNALKPLHKSLTNETSRTTLYHPKAVSIMASRKIVLVTGGNNGIGYEIVKALLESEKTYHILMGSRSAEKAKTAIKNLKKEVPKTANTVEILQVDLTSDESIEKAFEQVKSSHGYINVLINNAGMFTSFLTPKTRDLAGVWNGS